MNHDFRTDDFRPAEPFDGSGTPCCDDREPAAWNDGARHAADDSLSAEAMHSSVEQEREFWVAASSYLCL